MSLPAGRPLRGLVTPRLSAYGGSLGLSLLGDQMLVVALAWHVLHQTGSATDMSLLLVAQSVPRLAGILAGGVAADRWDRRHIIAWGAAAQGALTALLALTIAGGSGLGLLCAVAAVYSLVEGLARPAALALTPVIVEPQHVQRFNALLQIARQAALVLGPAAGAAAIAALGTAGAVWIDAATFLLLAATTALVQARYAPARTAPARPLQSLSEGLRYVVRERLLLVLSLLGVFLNFADMGALDIGLPKLTAITLGDGATGYGLALSAYGIGLVAGAALSTLVPLARRGLLLCGTLAAQGLFFAALAAPAGLPGISGVLFAYGVTTGPIGVILITTLQQQSRPELLGRVLSLFDFSGKLCVPLSYLVTGWAIDAWDVRPVVFIAGLAVVVIAAAGFASPVLRRAN